MQGEIIHAHDVLVKITSQYFLIHNVDLRLPETQRKLVERIVEIIKIESWEEALKRYAAGQYIEILGFSFREFFPPAQVLQLEAGKPVGLEHFVCPEANM